MKGSHSIPSSAAVLACELVELTEVALVEAAGAGSMAWKQAQHMQQCGVRLHARTWLMLYVPDARCTTTQLQQARLNTGLLI